MDIVEAIKSRIVAGNVIPKPAAKSDFIVKGWGIRRGEAALVYLIPNHKNPRKPYEKGITISEWHQAFERLSGGENFTRNWFNENMPFCAKEGGCNFTTIGGIFELLGVAKYSGEGLYKPQRSSSKSL